MRPESDRTESADSAAGHSRGRVAGTSPSLVSCITQTRAARVCGHACNHMRRCLRQVCADMCAVCSVNINLCLVRLGGQVFRFACTCRHVCRRVRRHAYRHVCINVRGHVYRHVSRPVCGHACRHVSVLSGTECRQPCGVDMCVDIGTPTHVAT